jgi:Uma2 family endonuclease
MIRQRKKTGAYRLDEVWNGVYVMSPIADLEHQIIAGKLFRAFDEALEHDMGFVVFPPINVSDRKEGWKKNFRCPDASIFLPGNRAENCTTHYWGGPDFAVEVMSPYDRSRKKFPFYAGVGVRELLLVGRKPWCVELYRREDKDWNLIGKSTLEDPQSLPSALVPLNFRLVRGPKRPQVEVTLRGGDGRWLA